MPVPPTNGAKNPRKLTLLPHDEYELLAASPVEQRTPEWKDLYGNRAGIGVVGMVLHFLAV